MIRETKLYILRFSCIRNNATTDQPVVRGMADHDGKLMAGGRPQKWLYLHPSLAPASNLHQTQGKSCDQLQYQTPHEYHIRNIFRLISIIISCQRIYSWRKQELCSPDQCRYLLECPCRINMNGNVHIWAVVMVSAKVRLWLWLWLWLWLGLG